MSALLVSCQVHHWLLFFTDVMLISALVQENNGSCLLVCFWAGTEESLF